MALKPYRKQRKDEHRSRDRWVKHNAETAENLQEKVQVVLKWLVTWIILINRLDDFVKQNKQFEDAPSTSDKWHCFLESGN